MVEKGTNIPKLVDFGVACEAKDKDSSICTNPLKKQIGECCEGGGGSLAYVAPEALIYSVRYPQSDLWSLGATMYTIMTGFIIWGNRDSKTTSASVLRNAIKNDEPEELGSDIELLNTVIDGMTKKDITKRLTSNKVLHLLRNIIDYIVIQGCINIQIFGLRLIYDLHRFLV